MHKPLFTIAILGLLISGYLFAAYTSPIPLICGEGGGCHAVQESEYSSFFGLPTPFYGLIFYLTLAAVALFWKTRIRLLAIPLTGIGLAISAYLSYLEAFVIEAWCLWCVISAILSLLAFLICSLQPKKTDNPLNDTTWNSQPT